MDALKTAQQKVTEVATGGEKVTEPTAAPTTGGETETKVVETVDHRAPAGETEAATTEPVEIVHKTEASTEGTTTGKSMLDGAKEAVSKTVESAKAVLSSDKKTETVEPKKTDEE